MSSAFSIFRRAVSLWWGESFFLSLLNLLWLLLQVPLITGPAATAAVYAVARRVANEDPVEIQDAWEAFRQNFLPALGWGILNLVILGTLLANFWFYAAASGAGWTILRLAWGTITLGWLAVNLYYWPFWFLEKNQTMRATLRNSLLFLSRRTGLALSLLVITLLLTIASIVTAIPLALLLVTWVALMGMIAVQEELQKERGDK